MSNSPARPPIDLRLSGGEVQFGLRVQPKASRDHVRVDPDGRVKVSVTAAPADGEANAAVCRLLAGHFGVSKSAVRVVRGEKSREKIIAVSGTTVEEVRARLSEATQS